MNPTIPARLDPLKRKLAKLSKPNHKTPQTIKVRAFDPIGEWKVPLKNTVWDKLKGRNLQIPKSSTGMIATGLRKKIKKVYKTLRKDNDAQAAAKNNDIDLTKQKDTSFGKSVVPIESLCDPNTIKAEARNVCQDIKDAFPFELAPDLVAEFFLELGLTAPIVRQIAAVTKLTATSILMGMNARKIWTVEQFKTDLDSEYAQVAMHGLTLALKQKMKKQAFKFGKGLMDVALSFTEPTGSSGWATATASMAFKIAMLCKAHKLKKEINLRLTDDATHAAAFDITIIDDYPLLGCYLFYYLESGMLLGAPGHYELHDAKLTDEQAERLKNGMMTPQEVKKPREKLEKLREFALGRILASHEVLMQPQGNQWEMPLNITGKQLIKGKII